MGLSMDDLHTPTVPSGPTSSSVQNGLPKKDLSLTDLITERDRVEGEITALCAVLESVWRSQSLPRVAASNVSESSTKLT